LPEGLALAGFMHLPALAQAFGFGHPGQGFIFFHFLQNRCCITRSYLLQTVISKGDTDMATQIILNSQTFDFDVAVNLMDDDIREELHSSLAGDVSEQEFLDAYAAAHAEKFGEAFVIN
jgi:hypothetical protein